MAKNKENSNILDIVQGIQQAAQNGRDGAIDEKGEPVDVGLKRNEGNPIVDSRVMDGYAVTFQGNQLKVTYHSEIRLSDVYDKSFEKEIENMIETVVSFLKKEYKKITGKALTLTRVKEIPTETKVESTSRVRAWVIASCVYDIGGVKIPTKDEYAEKYEANWKKWLDAQNKKGKKPRNVEISEKDNEKKR